MDFKLWRKVQQIATLRSQEDEAIAAPPTQSAVPVGVQPLTYNPGQFESFSADLMRSVRLVGSSIIDPLQWLNQSSQVHDYAVEGYWQPIGQNVAALTAQGAFNAATLVPSYGIYMDTPQDVYANIARGGF